MNEQLKKIIDNQLNILTIKAKVYSDNWGNNSPEVKEIDKRIAELNLKYLDLMMQDEREE